MLVAESTGSRVREVCFSSQPRARLLPCLVIVGCEDHDTLEGKHFIGKWVRV